MSTVTLQASGVTNCFIDSSAPTTTNGAAEDFYIGDISAGAAIERALIKFDLSSIPAGAVINSATLSIVPFTDNSSNASDYTVYRVLRAWIETQATWNVYTTGNNWGTAGAGNTTTDREAAGIGTRTFSATEPLNVFKDFTLTASKIQEMLTSGIFTNNGFLIKGSVENADGYRFRSSRYVADTSLRPKLVIDYTSGSGSSLTTNKGYW